MMHPNLPQILQKLHEIFRTLREWHRARNSLAPDCHVLGIDNGVKDSAKWGQELSKRCEPLRHLCDQLFYSHIGFPVQVTTVTIMIGNSDDKLSQAQWSMYCQTAHDIIKTYSENIHFSGYSHSDAEWQNAAWVVHVRTDTFDTLIGILTKLRKDYKQDSIAIVNGQTELI